MVTRNKHDGSGSNGWWDDLPPAVKKRVTPPADESPEVAPPDPRTYHPAVVSDLSRLAVFFLGVAVANLLFLLLALSFLAGRPPLGH